MKLNSLWLRNTVRLLVLCVGVFGLFYASKHLKLVQLPNAQVTAVPFFLQLEISEPGQGGGMVVFKRTAVARRSDGSTASVSTMGPATGGQTARKIAFLDRRSLSLVDAVRTKTTWPNKRPEEIALLKARLSGVERECMPPKDLRFRLLGVEKLHNEDVAVVQSSEGGYRLTRWLALRLGCEALQYRSEKLQQDGSLVLSAEAKAVGFVLGEPDARLFDLGDSYEEALPSVVQSRTATSLGLEERADMKEKAKKLDDHYSRGGR